MGQSLAYDKPHTTELKRQESVILWRSTVDRLPLTTEVHLSLSTYQNKKICQCNSISFHNIRDFQKFKRIFQIKS